jgi:glutathione S-transferase
MTRTLYSGTRNASSWAFRAWLALKEANIPFEEVIVDIRKPQRLANLAKISEFSAPGAVPVLIDDNTVIYDSLAIMEYANDLSGGQLLRDSPGFALDFPLKARSTLIAVQCLTTRLRNPLGFSAFGRENFRKAKVPILSGGFHWPTYALFPVCFASPPTCPRLSHGL